MLPQDSTRLLLAFMAGILAGLFYFNFLRWTVQKAIMSSGPALWVFGSLVIRLAAILLAAYWATRGSWINLSAFLVSFCVSRALYLRLWHDET